jgi:hypothetical protein
MVSDSVWFSHMLSASINISFLRLRPCLHLSKHLSIRYLPLLALT